MDFSSIDKLALLLREDYKRVDWEHLECPNYGKLFAACSESRDS